MRIIKRFLFPVLLLLPMAIFAQVTTSTITGTVASKGKPLSGASVKVIHVPSGTTYSTVSQKEGNFTLQGLRAGGPYKVTIDYVGYKPFIVENFSIP